MIEFKTGDIFESDAEALVNTVNCVGIMGRGIALQFKNKYPRNFKAYQQACKKELLKPGKMFVFETEQLVLPKWIINFPTKRHWRGKSRIEDIESGLIDLVKVIQEKNIRSIAIPPLGAGLGGLEWRDVRLRIEQTLNHIRNVKIFVYEPNRASETSQLNHLAKVPEMTAGRAALIELMNRYLKGFLDPYISLLEIHKLMYFMQESGENLRLKYVKHHYGPYAENLRHVLKAIEGYFISGYADGGDMPNKPLKLVPGSVEDAQQFLSKHTNSYANFEKVTELVDGFESSYGLELLATVHWLAKKEGIMNKENLINSVHQWNERKKIFTPRQINIAYDRLLNQGWLTQN